MTIRTLLFDADEVLQYPGPARYLDLERILGFVPEPVDEFVAQVHAAENTTLTGGLALLDVLPPVLERWGAQDKAHDVCQWLNLIAVDHDVLSVVSRLRQRGYRCALATNQQPHRAAFMADQLRYRELFDHCFFSCEMGLAKPHPDYFRTILDALGNAGGEVLFIDDKPQNVASAQSVGMRAACFANPKDGKGHILLRELLAQFGVSA